jgi:L-asparaginase II
MDGAGDVRDVGAKEDTMNTEPLASVSRGGSIESVHVGAIAVVDRRGVLRHSVGDPSLRSFVRSALKPVQALPLVLGGGVERFALSARELALVCASHSGERMHVEAVAEMLRKMGVEQRALGCGAHPPYHEESARQLVLGGVAPSVLHNNCSGKHAGQLGACIARGFPLEGYLDAAHPLQREIRTHVAAWSGEPEESLCTGIDGCSLPTYSLELRSVARIFANLADPRDLPDAERQAATTIRAAMTAHPDMVGGTGRIDTVLMRRLGGRVLAKAGGEAIQGMALVERGLGVAFKILDGLGERARGPIAIEILRQLGVLGADELVALADEHVVPVRNVVGAQVGQVCATFTLQSA